jgi:integrase
MAQIVKRVTRTGRVHYRVRIRLRGCPDESATFHRLSDAKRWVQDTESAVRHGRFFPEATSRRKTLAELIDRYERDVLSRRGKAGGKLSGLLARWRQVLGAYYLIDVTPARIAEIRDQLAAEPTRLKSRRSPATVNRYLGALSHAFSVAVREWEWVETNPVRRVRSLTEPRGRVRFLSNEEREALLTACSASRDRRLLPIVLLALSTGARQSEILGLRWPDVDLDRGVATAHHTKNGERRALPILGSARSALLGIAKVRQLRSDLVFANRSGKANFPQKAWDEALEVAEIENFRFHDLRHTAASYLAMSGATLAEIAEILGHKTLEMVKRYAHLTDAHAVSVVERMTRKFLAPADQPAELEAT